MVEVLPATLALLYNFVNCLGQLFTFILLKASQPNSEQLPSIYTERFFGLVQFSISLKYSEKPEYGVMSPGSEEEDKTTQ